MQRRQMKQIRKRLKRTGIGLFILLWAVVGFGCGGGGDTSPSKEVTITGSVQVDSEYSAFSEATCRFVDQQDVEYARADTNMLGEYSLAVPPDVEGYVTCTPAAFDNLALATYCSTKGLAAGATLEGESVTIHSTVAAQIITGENPDDPTARKEELLTTIAKGQDPDLNLVVEVAAVLYNAMLQNNLDLNFAGLTAGDDEEDGINGTVTSGIEGTLISEARCEYVAGDILSPDRPGLTNAALADFYSNGLLNRADFADIASTVNADYLYRQQEIQAAFERVFSEGIGPSYAATTDKEGNYFLPVPANVPGYVRCTPPDQDRMVLAAYVPGRPESESLKGQDINPATTVHALKIATELALVEAGFYNDDLLGDLGGPFENVDILKTKEYFLNDIAGLDVQMQRENGAVSGFQLRPGTAPADSQVGLVAFCATALYNILYQSQSNVDYPAALDHFFRTMVVEPAFLTDQGVTAEAARDTAAILSAAMIQAQESLDTALGLALTTAKVNVTVLETPDGPPFSGATIFDTDSEGEISAGLHCIGCDISADAQGRISGVVPNITDVNKFIIFSTDECFIAGDIYNIPLAPMATVDITLIKERFSFVEVDGSGFYDGYDGSGQVTSADGRINCCIDQGQSYSDDEYSDDRYYNSCKLHYPPGTSVTLTAVPTAYSTFVGWQGGGCSGTAPTCTTTAGYDVPAVTPLFAPICENWPYHVRPDNIVFPADGDDDDIFIYDDLPSSCDNLTLSTNSDWITIDAIGVTATDNPNPGPRIGTIMVGEYAVTVAQDGRQCAIQDYLFTPAAPTFESTGGSGTIQVHAPDLCPWQPFVDADWITITSEAGEQHGSGTVTYTVAENTTAAGRGGILHIAGTAYMVLQNNAASTAPVALTIQGEGEGAGHIYSKPPSYGINFDCYVNNGGISNQCTRIYNPGTIVALEVEAAADSVFTSWTGSCSGQRYHCDVTMDQMHTVGACFVPSSMAELTSMAGLEIDGISIEPAELVMGDSLEYSFEVYNAGVADAQGFSVGLYISSDAEITTDDILIPNGRVYVDGLASHSETGDINPYDYDTESGAPWIPTDLAVGPAFLGIIIDEFNSVPEDVETNNTFAIPVHIVSTRQSASPQRQTHHPSNKKLKTEVDTPSEK